MTAVVLERPPATGTHTRERLAGTAALVRLNIRRERVPLAAWILVFLAVAGSTFSAIAALYPDAAERVALQLSISGNPSFLAITGPITGELTEAGDTLRRRATRTRCSSI